jgi:hydrogenase-4 membrane subunit HyfE
VEAPPLPIEFKDRRTGLVIFGILTMLMGDLSALFVPLMFFGQAMAAKTGAPQPAQAIVPAIVIYGLLSIALVWLGIGSMMARRWARALLLIFSWSWLIIGVISLCFMALVLPEIMKTASSAAQAGQPAMTSAAAQWLMVLISMIVMGVIFVILPGAWVLFYRSNHVKATCEAYDPVVRWTDRCPLPVLAMSLWLAFSTPMMVVMAVAYHGVVPVFGRFVVGFWGSVLYLLFALLWAYSSWALYKLDRRGWRIVFASLLVFAISSVLTYARHDVSELYALMGYPEEQIAQIQKFNFLKGNMMLWASLFGSVPFFAYLIYLRKFFPGERT